MKKEKSNSRVHSLDTLENEIYRLKLKQKSQEAEMRRGIADLRRKGLIRIAGSVLFGKREDKYEKENIFSHFTRNERLNRFLGKFTDGLSDRFADRIDDFVGGLFKKKRR